MNNSNITDTRPPFVGVPMNLAARVIFIITGSLEIIVGVIGNLLLLSVILSRRYLRIRSVHKLFIANLALCDLLTLGYWMTYFVLDLYLGYHPVVNMAHCLGNAFVIAISFVGSALSLTSITLNRYLHVCHDRLYTRIFTMRITLIWCLMVWVLSILIILPPFLGVGSYDYNTVGHICSFNRDDPHVYPKIVVLACSLVPMILVGYWNYAIYRFWKNARNKVKKSQKKNRSKKEKKRRLRLVQCWKSGQTEMEDKTAAIQTEQPPDYDGDTSEDALDSCDNVEQQSSDEQPTETPHDLPLGCLNVPTVAVINRSPTKVAWMTQKPSGVSGTDQLPTGSLSSPDTPDGSGETTSSTQQVTSLSNEVSQPNVAKPKSALTAARMLVARPHLPRAKENSSPLKQLQSRQKAEQSKEEAFVRSLRVVFFLLVISFLPYGISIAVNSFTALAPEVSISANIFLYFNNALNWIVYGAMNPSFRRGYIKNLKWLFGPCIRARSAVTKDVTVTSTSQSNSQTYTTDQGNTTDSDVEKSTPKLRKTITAMNK